MTKQEAIDALENLINSVIDRDIIDETCAKVIGYLEDDGLVPVERYLNDYRCRDCGREVRRALDVYCSKCGRRINWNGLLHK